MYDLKDILAGKDFIRELVYLREEKRKNLFMRHSKIDLINFSILHVKEIWKDNELFKYSYYWLSAQSKLIIGWDNAPHHEKVNSYPHHMHRDGLIESTGVKSLIDVISYLEGIFQ